MRDAFESVDCRVRGEKAAVDKALERVVGHLRIARNMMARDAERLRREAVK
jgi:Arc/MetJ family transcription regulator